MKNLKKTLALVVVFAMMLSTVAFAAVPADVQGTEYEGDAALLGTLNIMTGDAGGFRPNDTITRAEFAAIVSRILGLENAAKASGGTTNYDDVSATHWAAGYINLASGLEIINGYGDGNFGPEDPVTFEQALKMLVVALGYKDDADAKGGYPVGYMIVAAEKGLTDDVDGIAGTPALRGVVAKLTANSLTVETQLKLVAGDNVTYKADGTLLEKLDVTKSEGVITATDVDDEEVTINGDDAGKYEVGITNAIDLLGYNVEYYFDDDETLVMVTKKDNTEVVVPSKDITSVDSTSDVLTVNYEDEENDEAESITADATKLYFNTDKVKDGADSGSDVDDEVDALDLTGVGQWVFVDNDNDDEYDYVFATEYTTYVVDEVNEEDEAISNKLGEEIDLSDEDVTTVITKDGSIIDFTDLQEWDVLEVLENEDGDYRKIMVVNDTVEGSVNANAGGNTWIIGFRDYKVLASAVDEDGDTYNTQLGDEGIFYLDMNGDVIAANLDEEGTDQYAYAYVIKGFVDSSYGVADVRLTVLNAAGDEVVFEVADKLEVNGTSVEEEDITGSADASTDVVANSVTLNGELVKYEMNSDGEVKAILTSADADLTEESASADRDFDEDTRILGNYKITEDTLIFSVADSEVYDVTNLEDNGTYTSAIYDATGSKPKAILVTAGTFNGSADTVTAVVVSLLSVLDEDDNTISKLVAYVEGERVSYAEADDYSNTFTGYLGMPGGIVEVGVNVDDEMKLTTNPATAVVTGTVYDKDSDTIVVWTNGAEVPFTLADIVYVYENDTEDNKVYVASMSDVKTKENTTKNASVIKLHQNDDGLVDVIVIKTDIR